jgi:RNA polymerase sigma-70 factor, ECF subfamily
VQNLLQEYVPRLYRFALRLTRDSHAAEDLTQETFLRAWRSHGRLRDPGAVRGWLFRIAANLWRDQLRRGKLRVARAGPLPEGYAASVRTPETKADDDEDLRRTLAAMDRLPGRQREVLYLSACEGLSATQISAVLEISADAVKANLCLARKKLRLELEDLYRDRFGVCDR